MGPNKLSTFVPAANKSEVSPESELAVLVLVQDLLLRALEASNQPGRSRSEVSCLTKGRVSGVRVSKQIRCSGQTRV